MGTERDGDGARMDRPGWDDFTSGGGGMADAQCSPGPGRVLSRSQSQSQHQSQHQSQSQSQSRSQSRSQSQPRTSKRDGRERWCSQMALILGVPTVGLELQGTMQVPLRGHKGGELQPALTD